MIRNNWVIVIFFPNSAYSDCEP